MPIMFESRAKGVTPLSAVNGLMFKSRLKAEVALVPWSTGTDAEIKAMVDAYYAGNLTLADIQSVWSIGDERVVNLSAMAATGVEESHVAQSQTFVIMKWGGKELSDGTSCLAVVGQKNCLSNGDTLEGGYMNSDRTNLGGWNSCKRRTWCNNIYKNAIPSVFRNIFKEFKNVTANGNGSTTVTSLDYFAFPAEKEVFGYNDRANSTAEASLSMFTYYDSREKRMKYPGDNSQVTINWWERSPNTGSSSGFCTGSIYGWPETAGASSTSNGLAPFGCI